MNKDKGNKDKVKENLITKDTLIGDAIEKNPKAAEIMFSYGLYCIGCGGASMETIEQGAKMHGISDEKIEEMVKKMNEVKNEFL